MADRIKVMLAKIEAVQEFILSGSYEVDDAADAITMLADLYKAIAEEEPVAPRYKDPYHAYCGACGCRILIKSNARYCHKCGRKVKWDA